MTASRIPSVEGGIQPTLLTAKGDLLTASATSTVTNLPVGADGQTLVANSASASGLQWQSVLSPYAAGKNSVLNSNFSVWQRGTSVSVSAASNAYTADRWQLFTQSGQASTVSRQATGDTTNLPNIQYCARVQRNSGQTGAGQMSFIQPLETANTIPFAGKSITLSYYARAGANFSPTSNAFNFLLYTGTGTDQNPITGGYTGGTSLATSTVNLTTTWTKYSVTTTVPTSVTELTAYAYWSATGTAGTNDYVEITGVQLEVGSVATAFQTATGTIQGELAACRRYLPAYYVNEWAGYAYATNATLHMVNFDTPARVAPTGITSSGTFTAYALNVGTSVAIAFNVGSVNGADIGTSGLTIIAGQGSRLGGSGLILFTGCEL